MTKSFKRATNWAAKGGELFAYFLMLLGVVSIYREHSMAGWISGIWYILIGVFVKNAAEQSYQHVLIEEVLSGIAVSEIMGQNTLSVSSGESLDELVETKFLQHKFTLYPVTDDIGQVVGVVDLEDIRRVPREERDDRSVADVMQPIPPSRLPTPATRATEALKAMLSLGVGLLPVIDDRGQLAGIVSRADIMSMFRIRADLGEEPVV
jgi:CBS domain-containing protein